MRIGIDMLAVQSPWTRLRGIGRLSHNLVHALLAAGPPHEYVLYAYEGLPTDRIPAAGGASVVVQTSRNAHNYSFLDGVVDRLVRTNPDGLDVFLILSPLDLFGGYAPPVKPLNGLRLAAYVHDVIPFLFQEKMLKDSRFANPLYRHLEQLRRYDVLLANSDSTREDIVRLLGLPERQVVTVGCASEAGFFSPDRTEPIPENGARTLRLLGIDRPFVFNLGGMDEENDRKNLLGLIDAFGLLPETVRRSHQLVLSCEMNDRFRQRLRLAANDRGVGDRLVITGEVPDPVLRLLYQRCAAFCFPSYYEGFGLPLLEAMQCGAAVVAGNNSSQAEVVGNGGLLANPADSVDIANKLARVLDDPGYARALGAAGIEQSRRFNWERTARGTLEALSGAPGRASRPQTRVTRPRAPRPRVAVFSPFPPQRSGASTYACSLIEQLKSVYAIDIYHDTGYVPETGLRSAEFGCFDFRLFRRRADVMDYRAMLYQSGDADCHRFVHVTLQTYPGVVTLHDFCKPAMHHGYAEQPGVRSDPLQSQIGQSDPGRERGIVGESAESEVRSGCVSLDGVGKRLERYRGVFERAERVIVHSAWCRDQVSRLFPEHLSKTEVIPLGARTESVSSARKTALRERLGLPADALVFGCFGAPSFTERKVEAVEAFASFAGKDPSSLLIFMGEDQEYPEARRTAESLGIRTRVRFLGSQPPSECDPRLAAVDVGIDLRLSPARGETSGALLDFLRLGIPTIVTDVGAHADYPESVLFKVPYDPCDLGDLRRAMIELASDPERRSALGRAARTYVAEHHSWPVAIGRYVDMIERLSEERAGRRGSPAMDRGAAGQTGQPRRDVRSHAAHGPYRPESSDVRSLSSLRPEIS